MNLPLITNPLLHGEPRSLGASGPRAGICSLCLIIICVEQSNRNIHCDYVFYSGAGFRSRVASSGRVGLIGDITICTDWRLIYKLQEARRDQPSLLSNL